MKTNDQNSLPFKLRILPPEDQQAKQSIIDTFPGGADGIALYKLDALLGTRQTALKIISMTPSPADSAADLVPVALSTVSANNAARCVLCLPRLDARNIVNHALKRSESASNAVLTSGEQGVLLYALDRAGGDWLSAGGAPFFVRGFLADTAQIDDYLWQKPCWRVDGRLEGPDIPAIQIQLWFHLPSLSDQVQEIPRVKPPSRNLRAVPVALHIAVGWTNLNTMDVANLTAGDLVILDHISHPQTTSHSDDTVIYSGTWNRACRWIDRRTLAFLESSSRDNTMKENTKNFKTMVTQLHAPLDNDSGQMQVVVQVEIGHVKMTVAEAAALLPGSTLCLDREVGPEVALRVGEKLIAQGQLVEYEGQLAVEVTEVK